MPKIHSFWKSRTRIGSRGRAGPPSPPRSHGPPVQVRRPHGGRVPWLEPVPGLGGVHAHALPRSSVPRRKDPDSALLHDMDHGPVRAPHIQGLVGADGPVVGLGIPLGDAVRREEVVLPHEPQDALHGDPDLPFVLETVVNLAVPLPGEGGGGQVLPDVRQELGVGDEGLGAPPLGGWAFLAPEVEGGTWDLPHAAHASKAIAPSCGRGGRRAHFLDLPGRKPTVLRPFRAAARSPSPSPQCAAGPRQAGPAGVTLALLHGPSIRQGLVAPCLQAADLDLDLPGHVVQGLAPK